ncbi:nitrate reductase [Olivibacter domesticus]|uniref:nitrate reductase (cytochrome) n=1 Tax=Olivibacter domesticus TaxID=407022 RepID=A0A1H7MHT1_OLID1|nr:nitrate reductase [Olivibacter domesticus]SEL10732.1 ferredoxin-nitrate reductase [Olivibacter domesticus]
MKESNDKSTTQLKSTCCYCGVGCGVIIEKQFNGLINIKGDESHPSNRGLLCSKGMNLHHTVNDQSDRLLFPQMRYGKHLPLLRVDWNTALERAAAVFSTFIEKYGPDSVAFYASGQCLTEEYYVLNKLVKGFIGTNNIDTNSRLCMSSAVAAYKMALGEDTVPVCYDDIELSDCIFVAGANPAWCHPIIWRRVEQHKAANPSVKIIVIDPRVTDSCAIADLHLQLNPGTDITLFHAIAKILIENGQIDASFIQLHATGFDAFKRMLAQQSVHEAALICGLSESQIQLAANYIAQSNGFLSMWTMGLNQSAVGVNKNLSLLNLHLITGKIGKPGSGPLSLTGQPNAMGGREVGGLANLLPAHRDLGNSAHRQEVQVFWGGKEIGSKPGLTATEMFDALADGRLKAIWIACTNPLISLPDVRKAEEALKKAKFVVVQEISNKAETLPYADVVLPAAAWSEKEGTMTNSERRISYLPKGNIAPGEALADQEIFCRFAKKMHFKGFDFPNTEAIYLEHAQLTKGTNIDISQLNYRLIQESRSIQWPYKNQQSTPRLFTDHAFHTPDKKARIHTVTANFNSEQPDDQYPYILTTGRIRDQWHTRSKTSKVNKLNQHIPRAYLTVHPIDAKPLGLREDDIVIVRSRRGEVTVPCKIDRAIKPGVVFLPMHWGKISGSDLNRVNNLTNKLLDPISKEPDFKFCAVQIEKFKKPKQRIVIIGAGAGAYGFVKTYREKNQDDEIIIFSKENFPFYNRVMLPDYICGEQSWEQLIKMPEEEEKDFNITLHKGLAVTLIDRKAKKVTDNRGLKTSYDILVMATGSRPTLPKGVPLLEGIFTMRSRTDADQFKSYTPIDGHVVIVGGGLLGLEMAASLRTMGTRITIIQRVSRFLNRQLDTLGSQLLHEEMTEQGCDIYYDEEIQLYYGSKYLTGIGLKNGKKIECNALIFAIGTTPNIELAKDCNLVYKRGITVNDHMQTDDPAIFAIGEIAEHQDILYGITAAAEQQATVVANYLNGDIASRYQGSTFMNIIKIHGFDLCSIGLPAAPSGQAGYEEITFTDKAKRYYKKCVIYQDRLVGTILVGDKSEFLEYKELIEKKLELGEKRLKLLRSGQSAEPVIGKLVCSCSNVGAGNLLQKIKEGHDDLTALCSATGAGSGCGSCKSEIKRILLENIDQSIVSA